jgi:hypothetical protein
MEEKKGSLCADLTEHSNYLWYLLEYLPNAKNRMILAPLQSGSPNKNVLYVLLSILTINSCAAVHSATASTQTQYY